MALRCNFCPTIILRDPVFHIILYCNKDKIKDIVRRSMRCPPSLHVVTILQLPISTVSTLESHYCPGSLWPALVIHWTLLRLHSDYTHRR